MSILERKLKKYAKKMHTTLPGNYEQLLGDVVKSINTPVKIEWLPIGKNVLKINAPPFTKACM